MRRTKRMFLAGLLSLSALVPVVALAASTTAYVAGAEYALGTCVSGGVAGETGSFAGYASASPGGAPNAVFNTTICHSPLAGGSASILAGGSFTLVMSKKTLVGQYVSGKVGPGVVSGNFFCTEVFPVHAELGPVSNPPVGATSIKLGSPGKTSHADGQLTHFGVLSTSGCHAYAATITGQATLNY